MMLQMLQASSARNRMVPRLFLISVHVCMTWTAMLSSYSFQCSLLPMYTSCRGDRLYPISIIACAFCICLQSPAGFSRPPLHALVALDHGLDFLFCHLLMLGSGEREKWLAKAPSKSSSKRQNLLETDRALKLAPVKTQIGIP
jgi:hypothetical protein